MGSRGSKRLPAIPSGDPPPPHPPLSNPPKTQLPGGQRAASTASLLPGTLSDPRVLLSALQWLDPFELTVSAQVCKAWTQFLSKNHKALWLRHALALRPSPAPEVPGARGLKWAPSGPNDGYKAKEIPAASPCPRFLKTPLIRTTIQPFASYPPNWPPSTDPALKTYKNTYAMQLLYCTQELQVLNRLSLLHHLFEMGFPEADQIAADTLLWYGIEGTIKTVVVDEISRRKLSALAPFLSQVFHTTDTSEYEYPFAMCAMSFGLVETFGGVLPTLYRETAYSYDRHIKIAMTAVGGVKVALDVLDPASKDEPSLSLRLATLFQNSNAQMAYRAWALDFLFPIDPAMAFELGFDLLQHNIIEFVVMKHKSLVNSHTAAEILKRIALSPDKPDFHRAKAYSQLLAQGEDLTPEEKNSLPELRFRWPNEIPSHIVQTILSHWSSQSGPGTDPRVEITARFGYPGDDPGPGFWSQDWASLGNFLSQHLNDVKIGPKLPCWEIWGSGGGLYSALIINSRSTHANTTHISQVLFEVSDLGSYCATQVRSVPISMYQENKSLRLEGVDDFDALVAGMHQLPTVDDAIAACRQAAVEFGLFFVEEAVLSVLFEGLHVKFCGSVGPLDVRNLLFFWED